VASFFVSRVDTMVDRMLEERAAGAGAPVQRLLGQAAIANAKIAYNRFEDVFLGSAEFDKLSMEFGARVQRPLWASTSTKNPSYPDTIYVDNLIGPDTVNTMPPATITAFLEHGKYDGPGLREGLDEAFAIVEQLESLGINLKSVAERLTTEGVKLFAQAFEELMDNITAKQEQLKAVG
jgi:transaldolase